MMKRICLVLPNNLYLAPYINRYISLFTGNSITILYWDRFNIDETITGASIEKYVGIMDGSSVSQINKLANYLKFGCFVKKRIK